MTGKTFIEAVDQYGEVVRLKGEYPRKELLAAIGAKTAHKLYRDKADGSTVHVGYSVHDPYLPGERWFTFYSVEPWEREGGPR